MLTYPAVIALVAASIGALFALLTAGLSLGPGWSELRKYSACAAFASLFSMADIVVGTDAPGDVLALASRLSLFAAGLHGAAWFSYAAAQENRRWNCVDRAVVGLGLTVGTLALVPGLLVSDQVSVRRVAWLGWTYRDAVPTRLGDVGYAVFCGALLVLTCRYGRRWRAEVPYAAAHFLGLGLLLVAAVNDSLTAARLYDAPYLLDLGFLAAIACVGTALTARFVASARSLDQHATELRATQAALVNRERLAALGELSAIVAHEVRNPIAIMFNAITVLRRSPEDSNDRTTLLQIVDDEARRLMAMVNDLLAYASPGALRLRTMPLETILNGAAEAAHAIAPPGTAGVHIHVPAKLPPIECDEQLVRQAVLNLITNAMQAAPQDSVHVRAELEVTDAVDDAPVVRIVVQDRGSGVPVESVPRLFTPFFTTRPAGTGLGLAIVRRVAEAHGGDVQLAPSEGKGATFLLRLPVRGRATIPPSLEARR